MLHAFQTHPRLIRMKKAKQNNYTSTICNKNILITLYFTRDKIFRFSLIIIYNMYVSILYCDSSFIVTRRINLI